MKAPVKHRPSWGVALTWLIVITTYWFLDPIRDMQHCFAGWNWSLERLLSGAEQRNRPDRPVKLTDCRHTGLLAKATRRHLRPQLPFTGFQNKCNPCDCRRLRSQEAISEADFIGWSCTIKPAGSMTPAPIFEILQPYRPNRYPRPQIGFVPSIFTESSPPPFGGAQRNSYAAKLASFLDP